MNEVFAEALGRNVWLRDNTSDAVVFAETFEGCYHLPPFPIQPPRSVLDLGANIGLVAAHYKALWPSARIVCVEPDRGNAEMIKANAPGLPILVCAVAATDGLGRLDGEEQYAYEWVPDPDGDVRSVTLAGLIDEHLDGDVDLVKMDVEGMEWALLERAHEWAPKVAMLLVELHGGGDEQEMTQRARTKLERNGYFTMRHPSHPCAVVAW